MKTTSDEILVYLSGYATHKDYDVEKFLALSKKVRESKEYYDLRQRVLRLR